MLDRQILLAALAVAAGLAGCLNPVEPFSGAGDGATDAGGTDSGRPDAGRPDAGPNRDWPCRSSDECPKPGVDRCDPVTTVCEQGFCEWRHLPAPWDGNPGACSVDEDCECQGIRAERCGRPYFCGTNGRCWEACEEPQCAGDDDCQRGQVCELGRCAPGCHRDDQCADGMSCDQVSCFSQPCPGICVPSCRSALTCAGGTACEAGVSYCEGGSCVPCPVWAVVPCAEETCSVSGGIGWNGCGLPPTCAAGPCGVCPPSASRSGPVCGVTGRVDYATFASRCEASLAGAEVLHEAACLCGEGLSCGDSYERGCDPGHYCRETCPECDRAYLEGRCTQAGACLVAEDCPAGLTPPACRRGSGTWSCVDTQCLSSCP